MQPVTFNPALSALSATHDAEGAMLTPSVGDLFAALLSSELHDSPSINAFIPSSQNFNFDAPFPTGKTLHRATNMLASPAYSDA